MALIAELTGVDKEQDGEADYISTLKPSLMNPAIISVRQWHEESAFYELTIGDGHDDDRTIGVTYSYEYDDDKDDIVRDEAGNPAGLKEPQLDLDSVALEQFPQDQQDSVLNLVRNTVEDVRSQIGTAYERHVEEATSAA